MNNKRQRHGNGQSGAVLTDTVLQESNFHGIWPIQGLGALQESDGGLNLELADGCVGVGVSSNVCSSLFADFVVALVVFEE